MNPVTDNDARRIEDKVDGLALAVARLEGALTPTLDKINDRQADTEARLGDLEARTDHRLAELEGRTDPRVDDHENRLRGLERFRYSMPSLALLAVLSSGGTLLYYLIR